MHEPHGFALSAADHRLLRGEPPARALAWCAAAAGRGASVVGVGPLAGGASSAVHGVDVRDARGGVRRLVLRRFVRADWLAEEPEAPRREAAALGVLAGSPLPVPRLVALDADGAAAGAPAVLMTRLPGAVEWRPADRERFLRRLAEVLAAIHAAAVPPDPAIGPYDPYALGVERPPSWSTRPGVWRRALDAFRAPAPEIERRFIHRDFHPGNVLWTDGAVSGVVDWVNASVGDPAADVGHCRMNLAGELGLDAAERFLDLYRRLTGRGGHHPYWDVVAALGGMEQADVEEWSVRDEDFLAQAVARL